MADLSSDLWIGLVVHDARSTMGSFALPCMFLGGLGGLEAGQVSSVYGLSGVPMW